MKYLRVFTCLWMLVVLCASPSPVRADVLPPADAVNVQLVGQCALHGLFRARIYPRVNASSRSQRKE